MMRRRGTAAAVLPLALALAGCEHSWHWKAADLDRNRLNLGLFRGADTGEELGTWVRNGRVAAVEGTRDRDDRAVVVRYERTVADGWLGPQDEVERVCYRFTPDRDGDDVEFGRTDCP
ncbi:hypothetical protein KV102_17915 [Mumia sp. zg.B53]|uniref:hypothetical protein n=1 Tax=Mumia sp. zg.B53 TaxID=2855449 RepID=UPI001C6DF19A|nr:hypothetical protein [Mumia sp. zg.B53]MBW9216721.1 hypothetical protein [Mumia sp. zg.B53]